MGRQDLFIIESPNIKDFIRSCAQEKPSNLSDINRLNGVITT